MWKVLAREFHHLLEAVPSFSKEGAATTAAAVAGSVPKRQDGPTIDEVQTRRALLLVFGIPVRDCPFAKYAVTPPSHLGEIPGKVPIEVAQSWGNWCIHRNGASIGLEEEMSRRFVPNAVIQNSHFAGSRAGVVDGAGSAFLDVSITTPLLQVHDKL